MRKEGACSLGSFGEGVYVPLDSVQSCLFVFPPSLSPSRFPPPQVPRCARSIPHDSPSPLSPAGVWAAAW